MQISNFQTVLKSDIDFSKYARFDMDGGENRRTLIFWVFYRKLTAGGIKMKYIHIFIISLSIKVIYKGSVSKFYSYHSLTKNLIFLFFKVANFRGKNNHYIMT